MAKKAEIKMMYVGRWGPEASTNPKTGKCELDWNDDGNYLSDT